MDNNYQTSKINIENNDYKNFNIIIFLLSRIKKATSVLIDEYVESKVRMVDILIYENFRDFFYDYCSNSNFENNQIYSDEEFDILIEYMEHIEYNIDTIRKKYNIDIFDIDISKLDSILQLEEFENKRVLDDEFIRNKFNQFYDKECNIDLSITNKYNTKIVDDISNNMIVNLKDYFEFTPDPLINMLFIEKSEFLYKHISKDLHEKYLKEKKLSHNSNNQFKRLAEYLELCKLHFINKSNEINLIKNESISINSNIKALEENTTEISSILVQTNKNSLINNLALEEKNINNNASESTVHKGIDIKVDKETKNHIFTLEKNKEKYITEKKQNSSSFTLEKNFEEEINKEIFNYTKGMKKIATALSDNIQKGNKTLEVINSNQDEAIKNTNKEIKNLVSFDSNDKVTFWTQLKFLISAIVLFMITVILKFSVPKFI